MDVIRDRDTKSKVGLVGNPCSDPFLLLCIVSLRCSKNFNFWHAVQLLVFMFCEEKFQPASPIQNNNENSYGWNTLGFVIRNSCFLRDDALFSAHLWTLQTHTHSQLNLFIMNTKIFGLTFLASVLQVCVLTVNRTHPTAVMFKNKQQDRGWC